MKRARSELEREAGILSRYLLGRAPGERERALYAEAMERLDVPLSPAEARLWRFMMRFPSAIRSIDTVLAFKDPQHPARRRIFTMLAILEASPAFSADFLPRPLSRLHLLRVVVTLLPVPILLLGGHVLLLFNRAGRR